jgi:hypothetical protein
MLNIRFVQTLFLAGGASAIVGAAALSGSALADPGVRGGLPGAGGLANAQSPVPDLDKVDRMQRQMEQLQEQMKQVKGELVEAKKKTAEAKAEIPPAFNGVYGADLKPFPTKAPSILDRVKLTWGGFLAAESVYRQHNIVSDVGTPFNAIPYPFSPLYGESEFHGSARASRLSLLVEGALDHPVQKLSGYYEMDFLGVSVTSNYNQSNSWGARLRQGYFTYDNTEWGFHFLGGQAWSLLTQNTIGITPRKENIPLAIDHSYVVGFDYTRNWQLRVVKDFGSWASLGVSVENPAELVYANIGAVANGGNVGGWLVNWSNPGNSFLGSGAFNNNFNADVAPDIIGKAAFDPGWGHYEVFGIARFFNDNTFGCVVAPLTTPVGPGGTPPAQTAGLCSTITANTLVPGAQSQKTKSGDGVGGSMLLPIIPKFVDFQASAMYGRGIGRYGAGQLSDVVVAPDGSLSPIKAVHALGGVVVHPWAGLDVYAYAGMEKAQPNYWSILSTGSINRLTGFGVPSAINTGCNITTAASFTGGTSNCAAINMALSDVTVGFWQDFYKGNYGRVAGGFEWEYIRRASFPGVGLPAGVAGSPASVSTSDNVFLTSLRYYPF